MRREQMNRKHPSGQKQPIDPARIRRIPPEGFSWIDRRFVRAGVIEPLPPGAILLYFFLVAVADANGLSFYSEPKISRILKLDAEKISQARARLINAQLILYAYPLYQVLPIPAQLAAIAPDPAPASQRGGDPVSVSELLALALAKAGETRQQKERP